MMKIVFIVSVLIACWAAQVQGDSDLDAAWNNYLVNSDTKFYQDHVRNGCGKLISN